MNATLTITISADAYELLEKLKEPGDSFSDVILQHLRAPANTCGELRERLESKPAPIISETGSRRSVKDADAGPHVHDWIAGFGRYYGEPIISRDAAFDRVPGIRRITY